MIPSPLWFEEGDAGGEIGLIPEAGGSHPGEGFHVQLVEDCSELADFAAELFGQVGAVDVRGGVGRDRFADVVDGDDLVRLQEVDEAVAFI